MNVHIVDIATDFQTEIQNGLISLHEWAGSSWVFFFSHPADFTRVCTTEMGRSAQLAGEFEKRDVKPLGLSTETTKKHRKWIEDVNDTQHTDLKSSIVADADQSIARVSDMIHPAIHQEAATLFPQGWTTLRPYLRTINVA